MVANHKRPDIGTRTLLHEFLHQDVLPGCLKRLDHGLRHRKVGSQHHADPLGSFEQFDHHWSATDALDRRKDVGTVAHEGGGGHPDLMTGENLMCVQLVSAVADTSRGVRGIHIHLFELANHRRSEVGHRRTNPRQDRVVVGQLVARILQIRLLIGEVDREAKRVENADLMPGIDGGGLQPLG